MASPWCDSDIEKGATMSHLTRRARGTVAGALGIGLAIALPVPSLSAQAATTRPFSITITHVSCVDPCFEEGLEAFGESYPDFYARVAFNGASQPRTPFISDKRSINPNWVVSTELPADAEHVDVTIRIVDWDHIEDDNGDVSQRDGDSNLDFRVPLIDSRWFDQHAPDGDGIDWPNACSEGDGGANDRPAVKVCFQLDVPADSDGDGLLDDWELNGYDADNDGDPELDLPAWGARVDHKDLFLEIDWEAGRQPRRAAIQAMKAAFAAAPITAGAKASERPSGSDDDPGRPGLSAPPNPDGKPGITLHVDTGNLIDKAARKAQTPGTCADGIDNGDTGLRDGADPFCSGQFDYLDASAEDPRGPVCVDGVDNDNPNCLVGDNLGGGGELKTAPGACELDKAFYQAKRDKDHFDPVRRHVFRYAILANFPGRPPCEGKAGTSTGGQGELGGNDFIVFNSPRDGGTIMHELGHNLNLRHGGDDHEHCKPNFVSVMNYDLQMGIQRVGGGQILDFSPPRRLLDGRLRGSAPLADLVENNLNENIVLDPTDLNNRFTFVNEPGEKVQANLSGKPNWSGDDAKDDPPYEPKVIANIDTASPDPNRDPAACVNDKKNSTFKGADDWSYVSLAFRQFGDSDDAAIGAETDDVPTTQELLRLREEINKTDLGITMSDTPDPVAAGTDVTYTLTVTNHGLNPATSVQVIDTLSDGLSYQDSSLACSEAGQVLTCGLGEISSGARKSFTITGRVPADLVHLNGGPASITNRADVANLAGRDPNAANNKVSESTKVIAVADLAVTESKAIDPPDQILIGETLDVTVRTTVSNGGPSSPMDAKILTAASAGPGASVEPASRRAEVAALEAGAPQSADTTFTVGCAEPGYHVFRFTSTVTPASDEDTDPNLSNDEREFEFAVDCVVPVAINVKPGSNPNSIKTPENEVAVAVLTTSAGEYGLPLDFDATAIDPLSARFGPRALVYPNSGGAAEVHDRGHLEDSLERGEIEIVRDGDVDMVLHFNSGASGLTGTDSEGCVKGSFEDPETGQIYRFFGCDAVRVVR